MPSACPSRVPASWRPRRRTPARWWAARPVRSVALVLAVTLGSACELEETTVVDVEDVVVAEVFVNLEAEPGRNAVVAYLHRTLGTGDDGVADLSASEITITRADASSFRLVARELADCVRTDAGERGVCFDAEPADAAGLRDGELLTLRIDLIDGGVLEGATRLPGDFELDEPEPVCRLDPDTLLPVSWASSADAWAYVNETLIRGLPDALASEGITDVDDPLYLLGLSVADDDTAIVFPSEFGVFDRFDLPQDLSVRLQRGLPDGVDAEISITAVDRNYVNWARGGNFNPSGQVRIPSLRGSGTGVFAGTVLRRFLVVSSPDRDAPIPECGAG